MWMDKNYKVGVTIRDVSLAAVEPLIRIINSPSQIIKYAKNKTQSKEDLQKRIQELKLTISKLRRKNQKLSLLDQELAKFKKLLSASKSLTDTVEATRIFNVNIHRHKHRILIDKGRGDCVYQDQALIDAYGVMGQVIRVQERISTVRLLTDQNHIMPIQFKKSGIRTIAYGTGRKWEVRLPNLSTSIDIEEGQEVVTSGLGQIYPYGYSVGKVAKILPGAKFKIATIIPSAHLNRTRTALLVWSGKIVKENPRIKKCMAQKKKLRGKNAAKK